MALRAGYFGLKRFEKNKLSVLAASMPSDIGPDNPIASKGDISTTVDLMKDTTGWIGKSKVPNTASSTSIGNVAFTVNENKTVRVVASNNSLYQALTINSNIGEYLEVGKKYTLSGTPLKPSGATYRQFELRIRKNSNNDVVVSDVGNSVEFTYTQEMAQADTYRLDIAIFDGTTYDGLFAPMITTSEEYKLSPTYEPYHESVEEMLIDNCKIHRYSFSNDTDPKSFSIGNTPLMIIAKHNGGDNISVFFVVSNTDTIATIADVGNKFTLTKDVNNVYTITSSEAYWSLVFIGDTIPTVTNVTNREISAEPEVKVTKKANKKKVIKEEE